MLATDMRSSRRHVPLVVVLALDPRIGAAAIRTWRDRGAVVAQAHDAGGCLRMATSTGPDIILLDRRAPDRLVKLLAAHPVSSQATIEWLSDTASAFERRAA
jgi:DNA-binding response OmpR family regulator